MTTTSTGRAARYDLGGKVAAVTGAGSGIGRAVALQLAGNGAAVAVSDLWSDRAERVAAEIVAAGGVAIAIVADTSDPDAVDEMVGATTDRLGGLHIAVNNAGIGGHGLNAAEYGTDEWRQVLSVNLDGVFYGVRAEIRAMKAAGHGGSIINMASILGVVATESSVAYSAAKHGVIGLTKAAALAHAADGIRVNAVGPGYIDTPLLEGRLTDEERAALALLHPLGRLGQAAEVAELVTWLASDASSFATGSFYPIDGGYLAR
jgi:NAD(P)-dependent dehydrogenase (short-subunit alcohol dehydrogenase family)